MVNRHDLRAHLAASGGIVSLPHAPHLEHVVRHDSVRGALVRVLPGVHVVPELAHDVPTLATALTLRHPDAVVIGRAAAALTFLPTVAVPQVHAAVRATGGAPYFRFSRELVPPEWVIDHQGVRVTSVPMTAIDLVPDLGSDVIDDALRHARGRGPAMLEAMWRAHRSRPGRIGNAERERVLHDSRGLPWSAAERLGHRELRNHAIGGWTANLPVVLDGEQFFADIAFARLRRIIEIDGWATHNTREAFEHDRHKRNLFNDHGWKVRQFTWRTVSDGPRFIAAVRRLLGEVE